MPIMKCTCTDHIGDASRFQNARYGSGMRVFNPGGGKKRGQFYCTVCGANKTMGTKETPAAAAPIVASKIAKA
jgi:hypothetical protein